jgi:hypothetical protein
LRPPRLSGPSKTFTSFLLLSIEKRWNGLPETQLESLLDGENDDVLVAAEEPLGAGLLGPVGHGSEA